MTRLETFSACQLQFNDDLKLERLYYSYRVDYHSQCEDGPSLYLEDFVHQWPQAIHVCVPQVWSLLLSSKANSKFLYPRQSSVIGRTQIARSFTTNNGTVQIDLANHPWVLENWPSKEILTQNFSSALSLDFHAMISVHLCASFSQSLELVGFVSVVLQYSVT